MSNANTHEGTTSLTNPDIDRTLEVAYVSKQYRSLEAAGRMIDAVLNEHAKASDEPNLAHDADTAQRIYDLYGIYPEAFTYLAPPMGDYTPKDVLDKLPFIYENGGLPLQRREDVLCTYERIPDSELIAKAQRREDLAAALWDHPPSQAFLDTFGISLEEYSESPQAAIESLLQRSLKWQTKADVLTTGRNAFAWENATTKEDQEFYFGMLLIKMRKVLSEDIPGVNVSKEIEVALQTLEETPKDQVDDLRPIMRLMQQEVIERSTEISRNLVRAYQMVISGAAARYEPIETLELATS